MPECFLSSDELILRARFKRCKKSQSAGYEEERKNTSASESRVRKRGFNHEMSKRHEVGKVCPRYVISNTVDLVNVGKVRYFATRVVCLFQVSQETIRQNLIMM